MLDTDGSTQLPYGIQPPAYRLPSKAHVGAVHLLVSDLPRSLEYYELVIGLRPLAVEHERAVLGCKDGRVLAGVADKNRRNAGTAWRIRPLSFCDPSSRQVGARAICGTHRITWYSHWNGGSPSQRVAVPLGP